MLSILLCCLRLVHMFTHHWNSPDRFLFTSVGSTVVTTVIMLCDDDDGCRKIVDSSKRSPPQDLLETS